MSETPCVVRLALAAALACSIPTGAAIINPVSATTNMGSGFTTALRNTINGVGLSAFPSLTTTHVATIPPNSWVSAEGVRAGLVTFNLGGHFFIDGFSFWNQNAGGPGTAGSTGIQGISLESSLDGIRFTIIPDAPEVFEPATTNVSTGQRFVFTPVEARHIRLNIQGNYGDRSQTGFAELAFSGTLIPEPAAAWVVLPILALLCRPHRFPASRCPASLT